MKQILLSAVLIATASLVAPRATLAHHSASMFDATRVTEVTATVKELQWKAPHIWLQVVADDNGARREWSLEGGSPNTLSRTGWKPSTFKPGDVVTVRFNPMKDGSAAGMFIGAKFSDGHTIGRWQAQ